MRQLSVENLESILNGSPLYSQENLLDKAKILAHFFIPFTDCNWLITEAERQEDGDWLMFGYCHITDWEWGYVSLKELLDIKIRNILSVQIKDESKGKSIERFFLMRGI